MAKVAEVSTDVLIAGQGLAGTLLAGAVERRGLSTVVVDRARPAGASEVAAGLASPLAGLRLSRTEPLEELLPAAFRLYRAWEAAIGGPFFHEAAIVRYLRQPKETHAAGKRLVDSRFQPYLASAGPDVVHILGGGYLETEPFLAAARQWLRERGRFREGRIEPAAMAVTPNGVGWDGIHARYAVFCSGASAAFRGLWSDLPMRPVQGAVLSGHWPGGAPEPVTAGVALVPHGTRGFRCGATYNRRRLDGLPDAEDGDELTAGLARLGGEGADVLAVRTGLRPTMADNRPVAGLHPRFPRVGILNGLGSRGTLHGPRAAEQLAAYLNGEIAALATDLDVARFTGDWA